MNKKDIINKLREEVEVPPVVQKKADAAFAVIHRDAGHREKEDNIIALPRSRKRQATGKKGIKKIWIMVAAVLAFGTINVTAAYIKRSKSLNEGMRVTQEQQAQMQEKHMTTVVNRSSTDQGVTVTALESITDHYYTHIAFKVDGYKVEAGVQPDFETVDITIDGKPSFNEASPEDSFSFSSSFYNGLVIGQGGVVNADGSAPQTGADGTIIENYTMEDGSLEYQITLINSQKKGFFINKPIHVKLHNLGTVGRAEYNPGVGGTWTLNWTLEGSSELKECDLNVPLGETGASVVKAEISPISLGAVYEYPRHETTERYVDVDGQEKVGIAYTDPPRLTGVLMKDGTAYPYMYLGPGGSGYESEESSRFRTSFAIDRILDVDQVDCLLFEKPYSEGGGEALEDKFYMVPVNESVGMTEMDV